jgi:transglutaminase-like putative cysteine protease
VSWRITIEHSSAYRYAGDVTSSYNEARITPLSFARQLVIESSVTVSPATQAFRYWDYWGTLVHAFDVEEPHRHLEVTATSLVETSAPPEPAPTCTWDDLASAQVTDQFAELLTPTWYVPVDEEVSAIAADLAGGRSPEDACTAALHWMCENLRYEKGATTVSTDALQALRQRRGVCQDFAHVLLAILRGMGIPARYTSGYLHPSRQAEVGETVVGQSHAWVEAWLGDWMALDPTNAQPVGDRHVVVGRARDYGDVSPLKGIYHGGPAKSLDVAVRITRVG